MLVSRDEQSCLVVSYKEVKSCIDAAFGYVTPWSLISLVVTCSPCCSDLSKAVRTR